MLVTLAQAGTTVRPSNMICLHLEYSECTANQISFPKHSRLYHLKHQLKRVWPHGRAHYHWAWARNLIVRHLNFRHIIALHQWLSKSRKIEVGNLTKCSDTMPPRFSKHAVSPATVSLLSFFTATGWHTSLG